MSGIGGQGVQLASQVLARAALAEGREVQLFGSYGGMMRGGNTETTLVIGDGPIVAPPTVSSAWSAILMHHDYSAPTIGRLRDGSVVLVNSTVVEGELDRDRFIVFDVPATDLAVDGGNVMAATMVMTGAYVAITGLVRLESVAQAIDEALPSYRKQHVALNQAALDAGFGAAP